MLHVVLATGAEDHRLNGRDRHCLADGDAAGAFLADRAELRHRKRTRRISQKRVILRVHRGFGHGDDDVLAAEAVGDVAVVAAVRETAHVLGALGLVVAGVPIGKPTAERHRCRGEAVCRDRTVPPTDRLELSHNNLPPKTNI